VLSGDANKLSGAERRKLVFVGVQKLREVSSGKFRALHDEGEIPPRRMKLTVIAYDIHDLGREPVNHGGIMESD